MARQTEERFQKEINAHKSVRDSTMSRVVRWEYFSENAWDWRPHYNVELTKRPTTKNKANYVYGYDDLGRVVVVQAEIILSRNDPCPIEAFLRYSENQLEVSEFDHLKLRLVENVTLDNGRATRIEHTDAHCSFIDEYDWNAGRLSRMRRYFGNEKNFTEYVYDPFGKEVVAEFRVRPDGKRVPANQPLPKGVTLKSLAEEIRKRLVDGVFKVVSTSKIREPIYCIALAYDGEGNGVFPPAIGIGLERERRHWVEAHGRNAKSFIWNPAEFYNYEKDDTRIDDDEYEQSCEWYSEAMMQKDSDAPARKLINEVAGALAKIDWGRLVPITDDFIVFAVDFEGGDLLKNMKKTVPSSVLKSLKGRRLL